MSLKIPSFCGFLNLKRANDPGSTLAHTMWPQQIRLLSFWMWEAITVDPSLYHPKFFIQSQNVSSPWLLWKIILAEGIGHDKQGQRRTGFSYTHSKAVTWFPNTKKYSHELTKLILDIVKRNVCSLKYTYIEGHSSKPCIKHGTSEKYVNVHIRSVKTYYTMTKTDHVAIVMLK